MSSDREEEEPRLNLRQFVDFNELNENISDEDEEIGPERVSLTPIHL